MFIRLLPLFLILANCGEGPAPSPVSSAPPDDKPSRAADDLTGVPVMDLDKTIGSVPHSLPLERDHSQALALTETFYEVGKARMRALVMGDKKGIPVLLLHGATFRAELWHELGTMELLAKRGHYVVSADLPGHGKSRRPGLSMEKTLEKMMEALDLDRPIVLGHSYAGAFIYPIIAKKPELLRAAILVGTVKVRQNSDRLRGSKLPVLVIWGENDELIPVVLAEKLVKLFPKGTKVILKGAMHECYNQATGLFHAHILDFVKNII